MAPITKTAKTVKSKPAAKKPAAKKPAVKKPAAKKTAAKKPAAKKPAVKKPAAKKPAVKKPAAKKPAAKKPAAKKPAAKKPAAKKPAVKKLAVKKPAAKKPAAKKPAVKKPVEKKPTAKKLAAKTPAVQKPVAKKPAVKKPAVTKKIEVNAAIVDENKEINTQEPVGSGEPDVKFRDLFDAYSQGKLPFAHGYIVSSFFSETSAYSIYEIVSYAGVKEIFMTATGLQFVTGGKKLFILVEHDLYQNKHQEPVSRREGESIPKRFNELDIIIARNQTKIMIAKEPHELYGSFTILKPSSINFAVLFYQLPDVYSTLASFFEESLNRQRKVPQSDAKKAGQLVASILEKLMGFQGEFQ
jgi:hypothetical protein